tara:strand:- start:179 stop:676 length:498 start_codon:yes stop_codon:yes gene_type:complete
MNLENNLNNLNRDEFISLFGIIFEKTQWIAEKLFELKPFKDKNDLINKMIQIYESSSKNETLNILKAHPKLAVEKNLTKHSNQEQSLANLKSCTQKEFDEFIKLNNEYEKKFDFPFIIAVKGKDKIEILNNFRQRINNNVKFEFKESKKQVKKIALFRLDELFTK